MKTCTNEPGDWNRRARFLFGIAFRLIYRVSVALLGKGALIKQLFMTFSTEDFPMVGHVRCIPSEAGS